MTYPCRLYHADVTPLGDAGVFRALYGLVPGERQIRTDRYRFDADKRLSLGAGALLVFALDDAGIPPADRRIARTPQGKPYLPDRPDVHISLSHSGTKVLCAVADRPVGCDAERVDGRHLRVAKRFFTPEENELLAAADTPEARYVLFTRLWVLKESFLKVTGDGLSRPMNSFSFSLPCPGQTRVRLRQTVDDAEYGCYEYGLPDNYRCACVLRGDGGDDPPTLTEVDLAGMICPGRAPTP